MPDVSGQVTYRGNAVEGAEVNILNLTTGIISDRVLTDSTGSYTGTVDDSVQPNTQQPDGDSMVHVVVQFAGIVDPNATYTYQADGNGGATAHAHDVTGQSSIFVEFKGAEGGPGEQSTNMRGQGASAAVFLAEIDVSGFDTLYLAPGQGGAGGNSANRSDGAGGQGWNGTSGGDGGDNSGLLIGGDAGGGGGGLSAILDGNQDPIAKIHGGGGGGVDYNESESLEGAGGGGGAEGGSGGDSAGGDAGSDADGTSEYGGDGGDGGNPASNPGKRGDGGGVEILQDSLILDRIRFVTGGSGRSFRFNDEDGRDAIARVGGTADSFKDDSKPFVVTEN